MPVSFNRFSDISARAGVRDSGIVTLDSRQDLRLNQSRFRLVRWVADTGIGKRIQNRRTVDAFISALQNHYGKDVASRMDFGPLRDLQSRGKPLHLRDIKAAVGKADAAADAIKGDKSRNMEALVDEKIAGSAYLSHPGGEALAREIRGKVNVTEAQEKFNQSELARAARGKVSGERSLYNAQSWADLAVTKAKSDIFLAGYGVRTGTGQEFDRLQQIFDRHPQARALQEKYGLKFSASRLTPGLLETLSRKLSDEVTRALHKPEQLAGDGASLKHKVEDRVRQKAEQIVDDYIGERLEALEQLQGMKERGEISAEDVASLAADGSPRSLADVVLHHRIPAGALSSLYALRAQVPDNLADLAAGDQGMEHKVQVLRRFGETLGEIYKALPEADFGKYLDGEDNKLNYTEDCARFLLEGKFSAAAEAEVRDAARSSPASDLAQLGRGIAGMRDAVYNPDGDDSLWAAAKGPLDQMSMALMTLQGSGVAPFMGNYTPDDGDALHAMRNCGIDAPPPDTPDVEQSGKRAFSRQGVQNAQQELNADLAENRMQSDEYPGFPAEATRDFSRAQYVVDGNAIEYGDADSVAESIRNVCVDSQGEPDERMLEVVGKLAYQSSAALPLRRFTSGSDQDEADRASMLQSAPFVGYPSFNSRTTYSISRNDAGNVLLHVNSTGPATILGHPRGIQFLDPDQSSVACNMDVEISAQDYTARITSMDYEYRLVPTDQEP